MVTHLLDEAGGIPGADSALHLGRRPDALPIPFEEPAGTQPHDVGRPGDRLLEAGRHASNDPDREKYFRDARSHGIYRTALYKGLDVRP